MSQEMPELMDHLFRREAGKMVSYLTKIFGLNNLALAEDVVHPLPRYGNVEVPWPAGQSFRLAHADRPQPSYRYHPS